MRALFIALTAMLVLSACEERDRRAAAGRVAREVAVRTRAHAERRLYEGAPPVVPHDIDELGRERCLHCHGEGDAVNPDTGYPSPQTPHPQRINCRQCHVTRAAQDLFRPSTYARAGERPAAERLHPLGPPYIPHRLQDREECEVCHLGPTARPDLVPAHGSRTNCTQCHVQVQEGFEPFVAAAPEETPR